MDPFDIPIDTPIVQGVARSYRTVTGQEPKAIGTVLPHSYSADDTCHLWKAGIPCLLYPDKSAYPHGRRADFGGGLCFGCLR